MFTEIEEYTVATFDSSMGAQTAAGHIADIAHSGDRRWVDGELRVVIWSNRPRTTEGSLFLSRGGVEAAKLAGVRLERTRVVSAPHRPSNLKLLVGDSKDT